MSRFLRNRWSTSVFAVGTSLVFQVVLLVSGVGTAWLVGDVGRGILAYGAVIGTLSGTIVGGGISSASAVAVRRAPSEQSAALKRFLHSIGRFRSLIAALAALVGLQLVRSEISSAWLPIAIGTAATAAGLVQIQTFVGMAQGAGRTNLANGGRLIAPSVYALGIVATAILFDGRGEELVGSVAMAWALGWVCAIVFAVLWSRRDRQVGHEPLQDSTRSSFRKSERVHFLGSLATYEVLRVDQLAAVLLLSTADLGVYSVSMSFTGLLKAMAASFGIASLGDTLDADAVGCWVGPLVKRIAMIGMAALALVVVIPFAIDLLLPEQFEDAVAPSRLLVGAAAFAAIRRSIVETAKGLDKAHIGSYTEVIQVLVLFGLALPWARTASEVALVTLVALGLNCFTTAVWAYFAETNSESGVR